MRTNVIALILLSALAVQALESYDDDSAQDLNLMAVPRRAKQTTVVTRGETVSVEDQMGETEEERLAYRYQRAALSRRINKEREAQALKDRIAERKEAIAQQDRERQERAEAWHALRQERMEQNEAEYRANLRKFDKQEKRLMAEGMAEQKAGRAPAATKKAPPAMNSKTKKKKPKMTELFTQIFSRVFSFPTMALMGILVGSGVAFITLRVYHRGSTAVQEPLLAAQHEAAITL